MKIQRFSFKNLKKQIIFMFTAILFIMAFTVTALAAEFIFIEAESGVFDASDPMLKGSGGGALNGTYIYGEENSLEKIKYEFEIKEGGDYRLWFRMQGQDDGSNSLFVMIDGAGFQQDNGYDTGEYYTFDMWEPSEGYTYSDTNPYLPTLENHKNPDWIYNPNWQWMPFAYRDQITFDEPMRHILVTPNFTAGKHTIDIMTREPNCYLDKIIITNDLTYDPRGIAGDPEAVYLAAQAAAAESAAAAEAAASAPADEAPAPAPVAEVAPAPAPVVAVAPVTSDNIAIFAVILMLSATAFFMRRRAVSK